MAPAVCTHGRSLMHLLCTDKGTLAMNMSRLGMCDPRCSKQAMITFSFQECAVKIARLAVRCNDMSLHVWDVDVGWVADDAYSMADASSCEGGQDAFWNTGD